MGLSLDEQLAKTLVGETLKAAQQRHNTKEVHNVATRRPSQSIVTFAVSDDEEVIEEVHEEQIDDIYSEPVVLKSNGHTKEVESDSSSSTSSSSTSSSKSSRSGSSKSSKRSSNKYSESGGSENNLAMTIQPTRLAQTFCMKDLSNELNRTRTISKHNKHNDSLNVTKKYARSRTKLNTWIKPKDEIIETDGKDRDSKMTKWISEKDAKAIEEKKEKRRKLLEEKSRKQEDEEDKLKTEKKAFENWESKKKDLLLEKIRKSDEVKKKREEKAAEIREKQIMNEKTFKSWKTNKETQIRENKKTEKKQKAVEEEEKRREETEKAKIQKSGFEKWCEHEKDLQNQKKAAHKVTAEIEAEIKMLEDFRKAEAEEEFLRWKKEKGSVNTELKRPEHPLGWAPPGKSKGEHRHSPRPATPGAPISRTLAALKQDQPHKRTLKTVDVCCRQITFWCHCTNTSPGQSVVSISREEEIYNSGQSTPRSSRPCTPRSGSRPCTPKSGSRPSTPTRISGCSTPQFSSTPRSKRPSGRSDRS